MINPLRSEAEAYHFLLVSVGYFAAITIAALAIGAWAGLIVFLALTAAALVYVARARRAEPPRTVISRGGAADVHRILVIANETVGGGPLRDEISRRSQGEEEVLVICPALNSPLKHWASDEDGARAEAQERLDASLSRLRSQGIDAKGEIGDAEPLQAIEDALRLFGADEIIISTHPEGRSHWLEKGIVEGARERFAVPVHHVVVDLELEQREPAP